MIDIILVCLTIRCSDIGLETDSSGASAVTQDSCWFVFLWFVERRIREREILSSNGPSEYQRCLLVSVAG